MVKVFEGKTTTEAIENGLKELKVSRDRVDIKILEEEKRSFFSILSPRIVKVEMTLKEEKTIEKRTHNREKIVVDNLEKETAIQIITSFVNEFVEKLNGEDVKYEITTENEYINISINGKNIGYLIGYRGETLNAIQTVFNSVLRNQFKTPIRVTVDICGYKDGRKKTLEELAEKVARKVEKTRRSITLDPMKPYERKIIHSKLQENSKIRTHSIGEEPYRKIVVSLKNKEYN